MKYLKLALAYLCFLASVLIGIPVVFCINAVIAFGYGLKEALDITAEIYNEIKLDLEISADKLKSAK